MNIHFLTTEDVVVGQLEQLRRYGGGEAGIRDSHGLDSAVESVKATFGGEYLLGNVHAMASAYLRYLVFNHPFENGNKRAGLGSALEFLFINGVRVEAENEELVELTLGVIAHSVSDDQAAAFFQAHGQPNEELKPGSTEKARQVLLTKARNWQHFSYAKAFAKLAE